MILDIANLIFSPAWQALGGLLFLAVVIFCTYNIFRKEDDIQDDEEYTTTAGYSARKY